jgi:hypothetical protein
MEYAAKNKLEPPKFEFESNGQQGTEIQWRCCVILDGKVVSRGIAGSKIEAKHCASKEAIKAIPAAAQDDGGAAAQVRRRRKEVFRARARGVGVRMQQQNQGQQMPQMVVGQQMQQMQPVVGQQMMLPQIMGQPMHMPFAPAPGTT